MDIDQIEIYVIQMINITEKFNYFMFGVRKHDSHHKRAFARLERTKEPSSILQYTICIMYDMRNSHIINNKER